MFSVYQTELNYHQIFYFTEIVQRFLMDYKKNQKFQKVLKENKIEEEKV